MSIQSINMSSAPIMNYYYSSENVTQKRNQDAYHLAIYLLESNDPITNYVQLYPDLTIKSIMKWMSIRTVQWYIIRSRILEYHYNFPDYVRIGINNFMTELLDTLQRCSLELTMKNMKISEVHAEVRSLEHMMELSSNPIQWNRISKVTPK
jgi:hypothetical protein